MLPTSRDYEQLQQLLSRSERNVNEPSYFSLFPTSSSNMSSSSTDTSCGSFESSLSLSSAETQEFRQYQLFNSSCDTSINHYKNEERSIFGSSNHCKVFNQISETPFSCSERPRREIIPETKRKNHQLELYNELFTTKTEMSLPEPTIGSLQALSRFPDLSLTPSSTPYTANLNKWELEMDIPNSISPNSAKFVPNQLSNANWIDFETLESSSGTFSETSISKINMNPRSSLGYLPPVSPTRTFKGLNHATSGVGETSAMMNTGTEYMAQASPIRNSEHYKRLNHGAGSSIGLFSENTFSPVSMKSPRRTESPRCMPQISPIRNPINFEALNWDARSSSGIFGDTSISSITSISPGSIGYMPRVSPITNPINFEILNEDAKSSLGIKTDKLCTFCKKNGERQKVYSTHTVKVKVGNKQIVTCPVLRSHVCTVCGGTGDNAHTVTYCPLVSDSNKRRPLSTTVTLKSTRMKSNGKKRYNYNN